MFTCIFDETHIRMLEIEAILQKYQNRDRENLLPLLLEIQREIGHLSQKVILSVAAHLKIPSSKVYAVASFYDQFRFQPKSKYRILICNGTGCHIEGARQLLEEFNKQLGVENPADNRKELFNIEMVQCLGACGSAPVVKVNDVFYTNVNIDMIPEIIAAIKAKEEI
ncbi:MAG: NAD(P)H-dependent oxidoreductase subunit E [Sphingobacteriia bacterium]|nr:NAD(P)H-dependent oxidoreductase subunit E [Sphingobacteriia bacterium]